MKTIVCSAVAACVAIALGAPASAVAAGPTSVNSCTTITSPGSYILTKNVVTSGTGICFYLHANDITFDFDGFTATGDGGGTGVGIEGNGIVVRNGTLRAFGFGVSIVTHGPVRDLREGAVIEKMQVLDMTGAGVGGGFGTVRDSFFAGNGNTAIALGGGPSIIMNNRVVGNSRAGVSAGDGSNISGNVISFNNAMAFSSGLTVECPSLVINNTIVGHALNFTMFGAGCVVEHNVIGP